MTTNQTVGINKIGLFAAMVIGCLLVFGSPLWATSDHSVYGELLTEYTRDGHVDYAGLKAAESRLDAYLDELSVVDPETLSPHDRFAFFVNAYNAWTIKLILSDYPGIESIKDLGNVFKSPWKRKFVVLNQKKVTLDHIENDILRPEFKDPRVHFAINCASLGCPPLFNEPFIGNRLEQQLNTVTKAFINDNQYNRLEDNTLFVSKIFKWFKKDFNDDVIGFFEQYASRELRQQINERKTTLEIAYLDYDWGLNGR
mgnify:CR=1 FL=1